jgi:pimeloyl-ACP methyl ester carboxylesterase
MVLRLNAVRWGVETPTTVLLHGLGDGAFVWNHIAPTLAARTTVAAVELRGHGDSPHDPQARYEPETYALDVLEAMRFHAWESPIILIGHSLGATVAIHVASLRREQVRGLVLVDGGPGLDPTTCYYLQQQCLSQPWLYDSIESFAAELERRHPLSNPQLLRGVAEQALRPLSSGGYELKCDRQLLSAGGLPDDRVLWEKIRSFAGPILVLRGAGSALLTRRGAARMGRELPDCRVHTIPGAGHAVMLDNPDHLVLTIERFLSEIAGEPRVRLLKTH